MPERGPPVAVARHRGRRTRGLIALAAALTLLAFAGVTPSAGAATAAQQLAALPTIQPFNGETTSTSQFASRWSAFHFALGKGGDTAAGWRSSNAFPNVNGAFYTTSSYTATGGGAAAAVTLGVNPEATSRSFSLWLDARDEAGGARSGYELRFTFTAEETYTVELVKWVANTPTVLATQRNVTFNEGDAFAILDEGPVVSAWTNTGSGFTQLLRASDATFNSGSVGLSGNSNVESLTNFRAGVLTPTTVGQQIASLPTIQPFNGEGTSVSQFGSRWSLFHFALAKGSDTARGWSSVNAFPNVNGAFYNAVTYSGSAAAVATLALGPEATSRSFSLWLDARDEAGGVRSGYELRFTVTAEETYTVELMKWVVGVSTVLATQRNVAFVEGDAFAILDQGGTVSAWTNTGSGFAQLLSASDTAFSSGSVGLSTNSNAAFLTAFQAGQLPPAAPTLTRTTPASGADNNAPFIVGTAGSGTTVKLYTSATCSGSPIATGTASALASPGLQVSLADNTTTTFYATATDPLNNVSDCSTGISYTERTVPGGIAAGLASLPQLDAFATPENPLSGGGRWTQLAWARERGQVAGRGTLGGWGPVEGFPVVNGAYWNPTSFTDSGTGTAVAATLSVGTQAAERWFSLWLDTPEPALVQSGYELRFTNVDNANSYDVTLSKWVSGVRTTLATVRGSTLAPQSSFALVDTGATLSAWADTGSGYRQLLTTTDTTFSRGYVGIEGAGNITRVRQFRAGVPVQSETSAKLGSLPIVEAFATEENPLSGGGRWTQNSFAATPGRVAGSGTSGGWGPGSSFPTANGAFWNAARYADEGSGAAVAGTLSAGPSSNERWFSLWLDLVEPERAQNGYELRFTQTATANTYNVTLSKWVSGARTTLATASGYAFAPQSSFALVDKGGTVSAWVDTGSGFAQLLSASDATFSRGYAGIEGAGNITRIRNFRVG